MDSRLIKLALCYSEVFSSPLNPKEIHCWLPLKKTDQKSVKTALNNLVKTKQIFFTNGYYSLKKRHFSKEKSVYNSKMATAKRAARLLRFIGFIKLVAVSGSTAAGRPKASSDIDLFIICSHNTVWITRALCAFVLSVFKLKRKRTSNSVANTICLNMFLDINNLAISSRNIYSAREILQIAPILNKNHTYERFLNQNLWVYKIFPNYKKNISIHKQKGNSWPMFILLPLALIFYYSQYFYMYKRITKEVVTFNEIRFHPTDYQTLILNKFTKIISSQKLKLTKAESELLFVG